MKMTISLPLAQLKSWHKNFYQVFPTHNCRPPVHAGPELVTFHKEELRRLAFSSTAISLFPAFFAASEIVVVGMQLSSVTCQSLAGSDANELVLFLCSVHSLTALHWLPFGVHQFIFASVVWISFGLPWPIVRPLLS